MTLIDLNVDKKLKGVQVKCSQEAYDSLKHIFRRMELLENLYKNVKNDGLEIERTACMIFEITKRD